MKMLDVQEAIYRIELNAVNNDPDTIVKTKHTTITRPSSYL